MSNFLGWFFSSFQGRKFLDLPFEYCGFSPTFCLIFFLGIVTEREKIKEGGFDILSFDGGGTKGVMEAFIMNDIMNISIWILCLNFD